MLKLRDVLKLITEYKAFAIDPENKVVLTKQQLGEMIANDYDEAVACLKDGTLDEALAAASEDFYCIFVDLKGKYHDPYELIFQLQYELAPRLPFIYRDLSYRTIDKVGKAIYKRSANRTQILEAMKLHLFSSYLQKRNFSEKFGDMISGVIFAENYAHVDENIAYDLLSAHLSLRDYYKFGGRKFYTIESLFLFLTKKGKLNKFAKNIDSDSGFFAWLYFLGKAEEVAQWKKKVDEIDNYVENKKGEY
jgi:hypothetical protein